VVGLVEWAAARGYQVPPVPWSLQRSSRGRARVAAALQGAWAGARTLAARWRPRGTRLSARRPAPDRS
jgi:hypothetical protein